MRPLLRTLLLWPVLWLALSQTAAWQWLLAPLAAPGQTVLFDRTSLAALALAHVEIVGLALGAVLLVALPLGIWATRVVGQPFLGAVRSLGTLSQTIPPVAVLFLALPIFGFGRQAVVLALFVYGLMPSLQGVLTGLSTVSPAVREAARGMGLEGFDLFRQVEWPLALPALLAGVRTSAVLLTATATLAPMVGVESLGTPILAGLAVDNTAQVAEGTVAVALLAMLTSATLRSLEHILTPWSRQTA